MIRKILIIAICSVLSSCGGFSIMAGLKFKKEAASKTGDRFKSDIVKLNIDTGIGFNRPIGECGAGVVLFGILLPIIPVWGYLNRCEKSFDISVSDVIVLNTKLKYNGIIYDPYETQKLFEIYGQDKKSYEYGKKFKFHIPNFWKFRMADDKAIIVSGKTEDGKEFIEELPVKWGIMFYNNWSLPN